MIVAPAELIVVGRADFTMVRLGFAGPGTVNDEVAVTFVSAAEYPVAVPVLLTEPAVTSAAVVTYVAVQVSETPICNELDGQVTAESPDMGSVTPTCQRSAFPVFLTR